MTYQRLGRFDSARDEVLYYLASSEDWAADHEGNQTEFGAYAWVMTIEEWDMSEENLQTIARLALEADADDPLVPMEVYGYWVVSVNSQGFVHAEKLQDEDALDALWTAYKDSYERWAESQDEE